MRLQLTVDDNLSERLKNRMVAIVDRLNAHPEFAEEILLEDDDIQRMFTPGRLAHIDHALADVKSGNFLTPDEVERHFAQKESSWLENNSR